MLVDFTTFDFRIRYLYIFDAFAREIATEAGQSVGLGSREEKDEARLRPKLRLASGVSRYVYRRLRVDCSL